MANGKAKRTTPSDFVGIKLTSGFRKRGLLRLNASAIAKQDANESMRVIPEKSVRNIVPMADSIGEATPIQYPNNGMRSYRPIRTFECPTTPNNNRTKPNPNVPSPNPLTDDELEGSSWFGFQGMGPPTAPRTVSEQYRIVRRIVRKLADQGKYTNRDKDVLIQDAVGDTILSTNGVRQVYGAGYKSTKSEIDEYGFRSGLAGCFPNAERAIKHSATRQNAATRFWTMRYEIPSPDGFGWIVTTEQNKNELIKSDKGILIDEDTNGCQIDSIIADGKVPVRACKIAPRRLDDVSHDSQDSDFYRTDAELLKRRIATLPKSDQRILFLWANGFSQRQIAEDIGSSQPTISRTLAAYAVA